MTASRSPWWPLGWLALALATRPQALAEKSPGAYFLPEFALSPQGSFLEDTTGEQFLTYHYDDQAARNAPSEEEDPDTSWDAWGGWSECSRTCGGGAAYSLRRCLAGRSCEGQNIRYRTCSNHDCPPDAEDFRAQQCSAYNDVPYQGRHHEWLPREDEPSAPCALRCQARGQGVVAELAPKVLDGTRCRAGSLDMCISGVCQAVGCDRNLGSGAKEDACGVCGGDGSTCRLVRGQAKVPASPEKRGEPVVTVPLGSRSVKITVKGPAQLYVEAETLRGGRGEQVFSSPGRFLLENTTVEFQAGAGRQAFRIPGPLQADFIFKTRPGAPRDSVVQFFFYQPISHRWRQTGFFPCTVTCGGGYQLTSAECVDTRLRRVVPSHYCHYHPENVQPKPRLRECGMEPCPSSGGFKEVMPYDHFQPLPRWEPNPWTACSASCGGGMQQRSSVCVEESVQGQALQVEEWKCAYAPRPAATQPCNVFDCPKWAAMEWSQCTVTCGQGLRYRVVLCLDHRGQHVGGCSLQLKMHIKEDCVVSMPCHGPQERSPVEAKPPSRKQAQELDAPRAASEEPTLVPGPWSACSSTCGPGVQHRALRCLAPLALTQTETELPAKECRGPAPPTQRSCLLQACRQRPSARQPPRPARGHGRATYGWEYAGFTPCSATCLGGHQDAIAVCLHAQTRRAVNDTLCDAAHRPPAMSRLCNTEPCPPRWRVGPWGQCSASCGVGIQSRDVQCPHPHEPPDPMLSCPGERPHTLRACSQFDCPPAWHMEAWQQCSRTCGLGVQQRRVTCQQQLMAGGVLSLANSRCPRPQPPARKACARVDCPPQLALGNWSKCSVSCGAGTQRRKQVCRRLTAGGHHVPIEESLCGGPPSSPEVVRPCLMPACRGADWATRGPEVLVEHRVLIQTRAQARVHLTVGGRAFLLPGASVLLRCPVRRFPKTEVRWERSGRRLPGSPRSPRLRLTPAGALLLRGLEAPDAGEYQCVAGPARASAALQLLGPPLDPDAPWGRAVLDAGRPLLRALLEPGDAQLEAAVRRGAFSLDAGWFEELSGNLSGLLPPGHPPGGLAAQLIFQLVAALNVGVRMDTWRDGTPTAQLRGHAAPEPRVPELGTTLGIANPGPAGWPPNRPHQAPRISFSETVESGLGEPVYLTASAHTVTLRCEPPGPPGHTYSWTKNGVPLPASERISWDGQGVLQIQRPQREDQGTYACSPAGELGAAPHSALLFTEAPVILSVERNVSRPGTGRLTLVVGGVVEAAARATVRIRCPVRGVPPPTVTWQKAGAPLGDVAVRNGSLLVQSLRPRHQGTYVCVAHNALGQAAAASTLLLLEPFWGRGNRTRHSSPCGHPGVRLQRARCARAPGQEVRDVLRARLQKPPAALQPCLARACPARWATGAWSLCSVSCGKGAQSRQVTCRRAGANASEQRLASGTCSPRDRPPGRRPCSAAPCAQRAPGAEGQSPPSCRAPRMPPAVCPHLGHSASRSGDHRPMSGNCSAEVCDGCWHAGPWRPCPVGHPGGIQSRRVECIQARSCRPVAEDRCMLSGKPAAWRPCLDPSQGDAPAPTITEPS